MFNIKFSKVGSIVIQFLIPDTSILPPAFPVVPDESPEERDSRHQRQVGARRILKKGKRVIIRPFTQTLFDIGFLLVGGWSQKRFFAPGQYYHIVRFKFVCPDGFGNQEHSVCCTYFDEGSVSHQFLTDLAADFFWTANIVQVCTDPDERIEEQPYTWKVKLSAQQIASDCKTRHYLILNDFGTDIVIPQRVTLGKYQEIRRG